MYLYTVTGAVGEEGYLDLAKSGDLTGKNVYVNMTNKCPCSCVFCLRQTKQQQEGNTLWLKEGEPSVETMLELFAQYDLNVINELVFCGFGEPLERLEDVCRVIDSLKETYPNLKVRLNTIGLANLIYGRDVTPELKGRFDTVSISLNAPDEKEFLELTRSKFGIKSIYECRYTVFGVGHQCACIACSYVTEDQGCTDCYGYNVDYRCYVFSKRDDTYVCAGLVS